MKAKAKCPAHAGTLDHVFVEIECIPKVNVLGNLHYFFKLWKNLTREHLKIECDFENFQFYRVEVFEKVDILEVIFEKFQKIFQNFKRFQFS